MLEAEPGKLDIKRCELGILFISLQVDSLFKLAIKTSLSSFMLIQSQFDDLIQKVQSNVMMT